jgi:hypothetical protein
MWAISSGGRARSAEVGLGGEGQAMGGLKLRFWIFVAKDSRENRWGDCSRKSHHDIRVPPRDINDRSEPRGQGIARNSSLKLVVMDGFLPRETTLPSSPPKTTTDTVIKHR